MHIIKKLKIVIMIVPDKSQGRRGPRGGDLSLPDGVPVQGPAAPVVRRPDAKHETLLL